MSGETSARAPTRLFEKIVKTTFTLLEVFILSSLFAATPAFAEAEHLHLMDSGLEWNVSGLFVANMIIGALLLGSELLGVDAAFYLVFIGLAAMATGLRRLTPESTIA